jgi:hypothetical protein
MSNAIGYAIPEPKQWPDDGGARVEVVTDPNWIIKGRPRVVRRVGWRQCMTNKRHRFFSEDIARIRCCESCKAIKTDKSHLSDHLPPATGKGPRIDDGGK